MCQMAKFGVIAGLVLFCGHFLVESTPYTKCTGEPEPLNFTVNGCNTSVCEFVRSSYVSFSMDIYANAYITTMEAQVKAYALGVETDYPLDQANACLSLTNGECALDEGEVVTYQYDMEILESFPKVSVLILYSIVSDVGTVACVEVAGKVVDA